MYGATSGIVDPEQLHPAFEQAFNQRDRPRLDALFRTDALLVQPTGEVVEGEHRHEALTRLLGLDLSIRIQPHKCYVRNEVALLISDFVLEGTGASGEPFYEAGIATDVALRNENDRWEIVIDNPPGTTLPRVHADGVDVASP